LNPLYRSLFKPILNKASRSAYRMRGTAKEFSGAADAAGERIYNSPYYKAYMDAARGKSGRVKQAVAIGTPIYAYNKLSDLGGMPFRTAEPEKVEEDKDVIAKEPPGGNEDILITEKDKKETVDENTEISEETLTTDEGISDQETTNQALVEQNNLYGGLIENDSLKRIEGYKDVIKQFIGTGEESEQMQKNALLLQLGSALMGGKSLDRGLKGFMEVVGNAGMQVAPTLFQMGVERGKAEREIGAAALNLYMNQLDQAKDRSGPLTVAYENVYKTDGNDNFVYDANGDPVIIDRRRVGTYYRKSPEIMDFMDINSGLGYERYTFVDTHATKEGIAASGMGSGMQSAMESAAGRDAQKKYARYIQRGLNTMADVIMPLIIDQRESLTGFKGEIGRILAPKKAIIDALQTDVLQDMTDNDFIVYETPEAYQIINGQEIGFFIDHKNKYGFNVDPVYADGGKTLVDPGEKAWIPTRKGIEMLLDNPNRLITKTFETTLGLMLARDRQPTGRMLADVLRKSFAETQMTGLGGELTTSPTQVINNYVNLYGQLYNNMTNALNSARVTDDRDVADREGWEYDTESFKITGLDKFVSSYYQLRYSGDERYNQDIEGAPKYGYWVDSMGANIQLDHNEDMSNTADIHSNIMDRLK